MGLNYAHFEGCFVREAYMMTLLRFYLLGTMGFGTIFLTAVVDSGEFGPPSVDIFPPRRRFSWKQTTRNNAGEMVVRTQTYLVWGWNQRQLMRMVFFARFWGVSFAVVRSLPHLKRSSGCSVSLGRYHARQSRILLGSAANLAQFLTTSERCEFYGRYDTARLKYSQYLPGHCGLLVHLQLASSSSVVRSLDLVVRFQVKGWEPRPVVSCF